MLPRALIAPLLAVPLWASLCLAAPAGAGQPIGSYSNGCIADARELPPEGPGYQAVNLSRRRTFGDAALVDYVTGLAGRARAERLGRLAVGDLSQPRGGRMPSGHASHQIGLDVDVWFDLDLPDLPRGERERTDFPSMVDATAQRVDPQRFGPRQRRLLQMAAGDARVTRIFVNPAIKLALCEGETGDRSWLRKIRPWFATPRISTSAWTARPTPPTACRRARCRPARAATPSC